jgi:hypothetical protein
VIDPSAAQQRVSDTVQRAAHTAGMPVRLHHIVVDAHDLPALARFWTQAPGWTVLPERENEIVIGTGENAPAGMCFMPGAIGRRSRQMLYLPHPMTAEMKLLTRASAVPQLFIQDTVVRLKSCLKCRSSRSLSSSAVRISDPLKNAS